MVFSVLLYTALSIFILGLIYRISTWFSRKIGLPSKGFTTYQRVFAAVKGIAGIVFSSKILTLLKVFILDVVLQRKILKENFLRWAMHMLIYGGFMFLLLMHALDKMITASLFREYYSTLNPFFFLRDLFGAMVILGLCIAVYRRFILKVPRLSTNAMDYYAIIVLAVIMLSGVLLEGTKITSHSAFERMVKDYGNLNDESELPTLESFWVENFGLVSPNVNGPFESEVLEQGAEIHENNCASCHSSPKWAFTGFAAAKALQPVALTVDRWGGAEFFWYLHILACFAGLAYLPFSKMFHIITTPISFLANAVMDPETSSPANIATRHVMELDACTHCGTCSLRCSAAMAFDAMGNEYILPSEKMVFLKGMATGKSLDRQAHRAIQQGVYLCTNCDRCTVVCPSGINLKELWLNVREALIQKGIPEPLALSPFSLVRGLNQKKLPPEIYDSPLRAAAQAVAGDFESLMDPNRLVPLTGKEKEVSAPAVRDNTFSYCFGCQNCTTVCPVVASYENPGKVLGLLPHQIMCCLGLGLTEMASGPRMLWDCVTCYQCQEHCPQNVRVADLLYQLKNLAVKNLKKKSDKMPGVSEAA